MQKRNHRWIPACTVPGHAQINTDDVARSPRTEVLGRNLYVGAWCWVVVGLALLLVSPVGGTAVAETVGSPADSTADAQVMTPSPRRAIAAAGRSFTGLSLYTILGGAAGTAMAYSKDPEVQDWWRDRRPPHRVIRTAEAIGNLRYQIPALIAFWGTARLAGRSELATTGTALIEGFAVSKAMTMALKLGVGRRRPDGSDQRSFPSGHASGSFTIATLIAYRHGPLAGLPFLSMAAFTTVMRMAQQRHHLSDVVSGTAIGIAVGRAAALVHEESDPTQGGIRFAPMPNHPVGIAYRW